MMMMRRGGEEGIFDLIGGEIKAGSMHLKTNFIQAETVEATTQSFKKN